MLICFDIVRDLEELDVFDDGFGWSDEVVSGWSVSLDALASQCVAFFPRGIGECTHSIAYQNTEYACGGLEL